MRARSCVAALVAAFFLFAWPSIARAQTAPSEIEVRVVDAAGKPLPNVRVYISGPFSASALTPADGKLRFTDVEPGLYRLRLALNGYIGVDIDEVEALGTPEVTTSVSTVVAETARDIVRQITS